LGFWQKHGLPKIQMILRRSVLCVGLMSVAIQGAADTITASLETRLKAERAINKVSVELLVQGFDANCRLIDEQYFKRRKIPDAIRLSKGLDYVLRAQFKVGGFGNTSYLSSEQAFKVSKTKYKVILNYLDRGYGISVLEDGKSVPWRRGRC